MKGKGLSKTAVNVFVGLGIAAKTTQPVYEATFEVATMIEHHLSDPADRICNERRKPGVYPCSKT